MQIFDDCLVSISKKKLFNEYENNEDGVCVELINDLSDLQEKISSENEKIRWIDFVSSINADLSSMLLDYAMKQYESGYFDISCYAYIRCILITKRSTDTAKNNLAYIIRRNESSLSSLFSISEIADLLKNGLENRNIFSIVNLALTFILKSGEEQDWRLADDLFSSINETDTDIVGVDYWWENVGKKGDMEGFLVHFFLLRHQKLEYSNLGSLKSLALRLTKEMDNFPGWLAEGYALETLDDVIDCIEDPDFDSVLEDFLGKMPPSRDSVDEMLEIITAWDLWQVYHKLLKECKEFLMPEEYAKLMTDYKEKFSIPLNEEDE